MAEDTKEYTRLIPVLDDVDLVTLKWLTRESFDKLAAAEGLRIASYAEGVLDESQLAQYVTPAAAQRLQRPVADYQWHLFTATAVRVEREDTSGLCGYCAPHPKHRQECGSLVGGDKTCRCPGWPL